MKVSTFTKHFRDKGFKRLKNRFERLVGPMAILMEVDKLTKKELENPDTLDQNERITKIVTNLERKTALFVPPMAVGNSDELTTLNVDLLDTGGNK
jgi:hypothetical protein